MTPSTAGHRLMETAAPGAWDCCSVSSNTKLLTTELWQSQQDCFEPKGVISSFASFAVTERWYRSAPPRQQQPSIPMKTRQDHCAARCGRSHATLWHRPCSGCADARLPAQWQLLPMPSAAVPCCFGRQPDRRRALCLRSQPGPEAHRRFGQHQRLVHRLPRVPLSLSGTWKKLVDFQNLATDAGLYFVANGNGNGLQYYPSAGRRVADRHGHGLHHRPDARCLQRSAWLV